MTYHLHLQTDGRTWQVKDASGTVHHTTQDWNDARRELVKLNQPAYTERKETNKRRARREAYEAGYTRYQ